MVSALWYVGDNQPVADNPDAMRITDGPIRSNDSETEPIAAPDWNEKDTDDSPELTGFAHREQASYTVESEQYSPWWAAAASDKSHNEIIDNQVASSGTAAAREMAGQQGHGTMQYAIGIEPEIRDGANFGNDYFKRDSAVIQDGMGDYMTPSDTDNWGQQVVQANAERASRQAYQDSLYASLFMD